MKRDKKKCLVQVQNGTVLDFAQIIRKENLEEMIDFIKDQPEIDLEKITPTDVNGIYKIKSK